MQVSKVSFRKLVVFGIRISVVVVIYYFIVQQVPLSRLRPLMVPALMGTFTIAVALNVIQGMLCTLRWRLVAAGTPNVPGFAKSFAAYVEGAFFNQALPSFVGGDAVRIMRWRAFDVSASEALLSVFRDRLFAAIGAALFTMVACALLWVQPIERYMVLSLFLLSGAVIFASIIALSLSQWPGLSAIFSRIPTLHSFALSLAARPLDSKILWRSLYVSVAAQALPGISVFLMAIALSIDISFTLAMSITAAILLISMIPISLAGWGVREAGFLAILVPLGASSENALMLGICFGLAGLCGALLGGISIVLGMSAPESAARSDAS